MSTKRFSLGVLLTITSGRTLVPFGEVYPVFHHLFNDDGINTMGIAALADKARAALHAQFPFLKALDADAETRCRYLEGHGLTPKAIGEALDKWVASQAEVFGTMHSVNQL